MRDRFGAVLAAVVVAAGGCASTSAGGPATGPRRTTVQVSTPAAGTNSILLRDDVRASEEALTARVDSVWEVLPAVFERLGVEVADVDPSRGFMGNRRFRTRRIEGKRLSTYLDCGRDFAGPYADQYDVTLTLTVGLAPSVSGGTTVTTLLEAYARSRSVSGNPLSCTSQRTLEPRVMELIVEELTGFRW